MHNTISVSRLFGEFIEPQSLEETSILFISDMVLLLILFVLGETVKYEKDVSSTYFKLTTVTLYTPFKEHGEL